MPLKVVYVADYSLKADAIIGQTKLFDMADLKGKKIAVEDPNSFSYFFAAILLDKAGIKEKDVEFVYVPAAKVLEALNKKEIDAGYVYGPLRTEAEAQGYSLLAVAGDEKGIITDVLSVNSELVQQRPQDIKAIIQSLFEAKEFVQDNLEEAQAIYAAAVNLPIELVKLREDDVYLLSLKENIEAMSPGLGFSSLYGSGHKIIDYYLIRKLIIVPPDLSDIVESRFVKQSSR